MQVLLLVEDNPGDAQHIKELLEEIGCERYRVTHVSRMSQALEALRSESVEIIVLDLSLPDCWGVDTVKAIRRHASEVPIIVLTGTEDDTVALACIDAGAQDYLAKTEVQSRNLRRAIGYAVTRMREAQLCELQETLQRYRALSSATQPTTVTAALAGSGAVSLRKPGLFAELVDRYLALLQPYLRRETDTIDVPRPAMERIAMVIGNANGGPRDLVDLHLAALEKAVMDRNDPHSRSIVFEARLIALEMMGMLVDYYRLGENRLHAEGVPQ